ncbi:MAG TPA: hypothetical protein DCY50_09695 [Franconibacter helveticus]|uniref:hypothetical protein n=1 Tax=Franconibacter helveticus TaxID=357240 RepID=UPI00046538A9|nr:hypothetical protein [Franconibacter helveticus]HAZ55248.1 hypothetical protein [Franconibacter helveticus]
MRGWPDKAFGINPPGFQAAFGSKPKLYARVCDRYSHPGAISFTSLLRNHRPMTDCLTGVLNAAACALHIAAENIIRDDITRQYPQDAVRLTDFMSTLMSGLFAKARAGDSLECLGKTVRLAGLALRQILAC